MCKYRVVGGCSGYKAELEIWTKPMDAGRLLWLFTLVVIIMRIIASLVLAQQATEPRIQGYHHLTASVL